MLFSNKELVGVARPNFGKTLKKTKKDNIWAKNYL